VVSGAGAPGDGTSGDRASGAGVPTRRCTPCPRGGPVGPGDPPGRYVHHVGGVPRPPPGGGAV